MSYTGPIERVVFIHHTHTDLGFTHPQPIWWQLSHDSFHRAIEICERTSSYPQGSRMVWTCEVTVPLLRWLKRTSASWRQRFEACVESGQIACGALPWNITPLWQRDQLEYWMRGLRRLRSDYGLALTSAINHDVNGLPWPIGDVLLDHGVKQLMMGVNIHYGGVVYQRPAMFQWQTPTGKSLEVFNGDHYGQLNDMFELGHKQGLAAMQQKLGDYLDRVVSRGVLNRVMAMTVTHPAHVDNNPPYDQLPELVAAWNEQGLQPRLEMVTPERLFEAMIEDQPDPPPRLSGDWTDWWNFGCGSSAMETAVNQRAKRRLSRLKPLADDAKFHSSAYRKAMLAASLYDEHTWGAFCSIHSHRPEPVEEQWVEKSRQAWLAQQWTGVWSRQVLDACANQSTQPRKVDVLGCHVINPTASTFTGYVRVPMQWTSPSIWHLNETRYRYESQKHIWPQHDDHNAEGQAANAMMIGPLTLKPYEKLQVPQASMQPASVPDSLNADATTIRSPFFEISLNSADGRITQATANDDHVSLFFNDQNFFAFDLVRETMDLQGASALPARLRDLHFAVNWPKLRNDEPGWNTDWIASHTAAAVEHFETRVEPDGAKLRRWLSLEGFGEIVQTISLPAERAAIRIELEMIKHPIEEPEAVYMAFPLAQSDWRAWFDTMGQPVIYDEQQLPGASRDYVTASSYLAVEDSSRCVVLTNPDVPLWQIGGFSFGRLTEGKVDRSQALMLSWIMNNYWSTNFRAAQSGRMRLNWELSLLDKFDPDRAAVACQHADEPLEVHPWFEVSR